MQEKGETKMKLNKWENGWILKNATNENGCYHGGFNGETNKWEATVYPKNSEKEFFTSISHQKVAIWLLKKAKQYNIK